MDGCPHHGVTNSHQGECRGAALVELEALPGATRAEKKSEAKQYNSTSIKQTVTHAYTPFIHSCRYTAYTAGGTWHTRLLVHGIHGCWYMAYTAGGTWHTQLQVHGMAGHREDAGRDPEWAG